MDFRKVIKDFARGAPAVLEIGPSYNPITPKAEGFRVTVMDHASREELVAKYTAYSIDVSRIEEVDVIGTDLEVLMGRKFSCITASHLIEHTTDFVRFIQNCSRLLEDDGKLFLIIPDKRYCFDFPRPLSSTGQILDAHLGGKTRHYGAVFDQYVSATKRGSIAWDELSEAPLTQVHTFEEAETAFRNAIQSSAYTDAHEWTFTPSSFRLIVQDLARLGYIELFEADFHPSIGCEFFISLCKQRPLTQVSRAELVAATERELLSANDEHRALRRRVQELESRVAKVESLRTTVQELRAHLDAFLPSQSSLVMRASRRLRGLLDRARGR